MVCFAFVPLPNDQLDRVKRGEMCLLMEKDGLTHLGPMPLDVYFYVPRLWCEGPLLFPDGVMEEGKKGSFSLPRLEALGFS